MTLKLFGTALDALDAPERLAMKQAYLAACEAGALPEQHPRDPFDILAPHFINGNQRASSCGKLSIPGWLTPRPGLADKAMVEPQRYTSFMDQGGLKNISDQCADFVAQKILPGIPAMIGVDHCLTGGVIQALTDHLGKDSITLIVLDAHFDALPVTVRAHGMAENFHNDFYHAGNFLAHLMDRDLIRPEHLIMVGVSDHPGHDPKNWPDEQAKMYAECYLDYQKKGVTFITKADLADNRMIELEARLDDIDSPYIYVSLDADVGAACSTHAVRFMDRVGLPEDTLLTIARVLGRSIKQGKPALAGIDITELDVHLMGLKDDRSAEVCLGFIHSLMGWES